MSEYFITGEKKTNRDRLSVSGGRMIKVEATGQDTWRVTVDENRTTTHEVTISPEYYEKLTGGKVSVETLLEKSFEFLLERESNTSILSRFELPIIGQYFPEYENTITGMLE